MSSPRKLDTTTANDDAAMIQPVITMAAIKSELDKALNAYSTKRFTGEPVRQHYRRDFLQKGYSANEKQQFINDFNTFVNGEGNLLSDEQVNKLRKGNLGDALRSAAKKLAADYKMPELASVTGLIAYINKEHGLTNKNVNPSDASEKSEESTSLKKSS